MTPKALIRTAELLRMAKVAKEFGVVVEQEFEGVTIRVSPHDGAGTVENPSSAHQRSARQAAPPEPIQPPLDHREDYAMKYLAALGAGVTVQSSLIRGFGPHTQNKLNERGYVEIHHRKGQKFGDDEVSLTEKGLADWNALQGHRSKYFYL